MKRLTAALALTCPLIVAAATAVDAGWWNPLTKTTRTSTPLINGRPLQSGSTTPSSSSLATRVTHNTKKVVTGTVDLLTLKPLREKLTSSKPVEQKPWGSNQPWNPANTPAPKKSGGFSIMPSVFKNKEPERPRTMQEFLAQPRPGDTKK